MSKEAAVKRMLYGKDAYTSKTLIRLYGGYTPALADRIFIKCREIDADIIDIDIRPGHVLKSTFFSVVRLDVEFELRRLESDKLDQRNNND